MKELDAVKVLRESAVNPCADTALLMEAVKATRYDLVADHTEGKWAVRFPNGRRVASELDVVFQAGARNLVIKLISALDESKRQCGEALEDNKQALERYTEETASMQARLDEANDNAEKLKARVAYLESQLASMKNILG